MPVLPGGEAEKTGKEADNHNTQNAKLSRPLRQSLFHG